MAVRHVAQGSVPLQQESQVHSALEPRHSKLPCLEVYIFRPLEFAVAMPNYLFPGVIDRQAFSHVTQTLLDMRLNCLSQSLPTSITGEQTWEC